MALIICGECSLLFLLPLINSLLNFSNFEIYKNTKYADHPIVDCITTNILLCFSFIPLIFEKYCCNSKYSSKKRHHNVKYSKFKNPTLTTIMIGILYEIVNILHSIFSNKVAANSYKIYFVNDYVFELFLILIAAKIFSKNLVYTHQQISIIFIFILGIGFYVIDKLYNNEYKGYYGVMIFVIIKQILFGICVVFIKKLMEVKNYSFFKMVLIFGLSGFVIDLFALIISSNISCQTDLDRLFTARLLEKNETRTFNMTIPVNYTISNSNDTNITNITDNTNLMDNPYISNITKTINITIPIIYNEIHYNYYLDNLKIFTESLIESINNEGISFIFLNITYKIFSVISVFLFLIVILKLYPSYTYFTNIFITIFSKLKEYFVKENEKENEHKVLFLSIQLLITLVIFLWTLVYNEIIELNFCKLNEDTRKNKIKRNDEDVRRKSDWITSKGMADADATLVDDYNQNVDLNERSISGETITVNRI